MGGSQPLALADGLSFLNTTISYPVVGGKSEGESIIGAYYLNIYLIRTSQKDGVGACRIRWIVLGFYDG